MKVTVGGVTYAVFTSAGDLSMRDSAGMQTARLQSDFQGGGLLELFNEGGQVTGFLPVSVRGHSASGSPAKARSGR